MLTEMRNKKSGSNIETLKYDYYYDGNIKNETVTGNMRRLTIKLIHTIK